MSDAFESHLEGLFATQADLPDAVQFADRVERELNRSAQWRVFSATVIAAVGASVTLPILGRVLTWIANATTGLVEQGQTLTLTPGAYPVLAAAMAVVGGAAILLGRYQASEL